MTAKEMFEQLGFKQFTEFKEIELAFNNEVIIDKIVYNGGLSINEKRFCEQVVFDKLKKTYVKQTFNTLNDFNDGKIDMLLNKAIQKQIEELSDRPPNFEVDKYKENEKLLKQRIRALLTKLDELKVLD